MSVLALRPLSSYLRNIKVRNSLQLMHQANWRNLLIFRILQKPILKPIVSQRNFSTTSSFESQEEDVEREAEEDENEEVDSEEQFIERYLDPKDRSRIIAPEISIKYLGKIVWSLRISSLSVISLHLDSVAFKTTYGKNPVWTKYRRNFKGQRLPLKTRETCIRQEKITTGSPCPICRDDYLVIDYRCGVEPCYTSHY